MKTANRFSIAAAVLVMALCACALAGDWPQWRGPGRDDKVTDFTAPDTWPQELAAKWKVSVGAGDSTPALVGDRLYVFSRQGDEEVLTCLNAATGDEIWKKGYAADAVTGPAARHPGPRSSPAVADGKVVTLGAAGVLSCFDAESGDTVWRKNEYAGAVPRYFTAMSPIVVDGMAIAHLGGEGNGAMMAFDLATGDPKWKWDLEGPAYASPVVMTVADTRQLVTMTEKSIVALAVADGKMLWRIPFEPAGRTYNAATPIVDGDMLYITGQGRGTRAVKIVKEDDAFAVEDLWNNPDVAVQFNTPVLKDAKLYGLSDKGTFFCLDAKTGQTAWTDEVKRGGNFAAVVDAGSVIVALPSNSELTIFKPSGAEYSEVARIKVAEKATYAHPVIAGNRVFVKDEDSLAMLVIE